MDWKISNKLWRKYVNTRKFFNVKENSIAETIHFLLSKSKNPKLSCEEIENIFQDISRLFVENQVSVYFSSQNS